MSSYGPFATRVGLLQRSLNFIDLVVRNRLGTTGYQLWGARTLNDAYGDLTGTGDDSGVGGTGTVAMLMVDRDSIAQSTSVIRRGWKVEESRKDQSSFQLDIEDFIAPIGGLLAPFGSDEETLFLRVQENRPTAGGWLAVPALAAENPSWSIQGPILVVPAATAFGTASSVMTLEGIAPSGTGCIAGAPPVVDMTVQTPLPMHLVFPRPAGSVTIRNTGAAGDLLVSFGLGQPMFTIPHGNESTPTGGGYAWPAVSEIVIVRAAGAAGCTFSLEAVIGTGWG